MSHLFTAEIALPLYQYFRLLLLPSITWTAHAFAKTASSIHHFTPRKRLVSPVRRHRKEQEKAQYGIRRKTENEKNIWLHGFYGNVGRRLTTPHVALHFSFMGIPDVARIPATPYFLLFHHSDGVVLDETGICSQGIGLWEFIGVSMDGKDGSIGGRAEKCHVRFSVYRPRVLCDLVRSFW